MTTLPTIQYTARDFASIKGALISHVQAFFPGDWQDFLESNLGVALLELVAYVGDNLSFYLDRQANEAYLATAQQRPNVLNLARMIGYTPSTATASSVKLRATLASQAAVTVIPAYSQFTDRNGTSFEFLQNVEIPKQTTDTFQQVIPLSPGEAATIADGSTSFFSIQVENFPLVPGTLQVQYKVNAITYANTLSTAGSTSLTTGGTALVDHDTGLLTLSFTAPNVPDSGSQITLGYTYNQNIKAYQGTTRLDLFSSDGSSNQSITVQESPVLVQATVANSIAVMPDPSRFEVWVGDPGSPFGTGTGTQWTRVDTLVEATPTDKVFSIKLDNNDVATVQFGDGVNGAIPESGTSNLAVIYRTGGGLVGNISTGFLDTSVNGVAAGISVQVNLTNYEPGSGGAARESVNEIRRNAPLRLKTNETATTEEDFTTLSGTFSNPGLGRIAFAKARLTPALPITCLTHVVDYVLTTVADIRTTYYLEMPGTPILMLSGLEPVISYTQGSTDYTDTAAVVVSDQTAEFDDARINGATVFRTDEQNYKDESLGYTGDGVTLAFSGNSLGSPPVLPGSIFLHVRIDGEESIAYDDGDGNLVGTAVDTGTINYLTGALDITFSTGNPPDSGTSILVDYTSALYLLFEGGSEPDVGTDISVSLYTGPSQQSFPTNNIEVYTWAYDATGDIVPPSSSLRDNLLAYLQLRRVMATSVEVLSGFNVLVNLHLTVSYDPGVDPTISNTSIISKLSAFFDSSVTVAPGEDISLSGLYDALDQAIGVSRAVVQDVGLRVPIGTGDGVSSRFRSDVNTPGKHLSSGKLPMVLVEDGSSTGTIRFYRNQSPTAIGTSTRVNDSDSNGTFTQVLANFVYTFDDAGVSDWTTVANVGDVLRVTASTNSANVKDYPILAVAAGNITVQGVAVAAETDSWQIISSGPILKVAGGSISSAASTINRTTGAFDVRFNTPLSRDEILSVEYLLDEETSASGLSLWNVTIEAWELAVLGSVYVNGTKVN